MLILAARELTRNADGGDLSLADWERFLRMCDVAHRMGRRAMGIGWYIGVGGEGLAKTF